MMLRFSSLIRVGVLAAALRPALPCGSVGGSDDSQIYTNPTFRWQMNPPAAWTYPNQYAQQTAQYFPGQPLTQVDAQTKANGDIAAQVLEALSSANIPTNGVRVVAQYTPQLVSDCVKVAGTAPAPTQTMIGEIFGIVEAGAVTRLATATVALAVMDCAERNFGAVTYRDFIADASATVQGVTASGAQLRQVAAQLMSNLNFASKVRFTNQITFS